jgi:antitoxin ParD1/3/4
MANLSVNLSDDLQNFVLVQAQAGQYKDAGAYVSALIARAKQNKDSLESLLEEGLNSGDPVILDDIDWKNMREEVIARVQK